MHPITKKVQSAPLILMMISFGAMGARASSVLDFTATGTLGPVLSGSDPLGLSGSSFAFTGFIDESAVPITCPTGLPLAANVCYSIPAYQLTGQVGTLAPVTFTNASTLGLVLSTSSHEALEIQFTIVGNPVTAILQLAPASFPPSIQQHPTPFRPTPQTLIAATSVPPPLNGSSAQYCLGACTSSNATWLGIAGNTSSTAPFLTTLFKFNGTNGNSPYSSLTPDGKGGFYGTTATGGTSNMGTVFQLTPPVTGSTWTESVLYNFSGNDGASPAAGVFLSSTGVLYGTTRTGGVSNLGTVFTLTPPASAGGAWTEAVIYSFPGGSAGANPQASVVLDTKGAVYGTTYAGGLTNYGTVYRLGPPVPPATTWTASVLHTFAGSDGKNPEAAVVFDKSGALNGTTYGGGASGLGTAFHLAPPAMTGSAWKLTTLHSFAGGTSDGANPQSALVQDSHGNLFGTTIGAGFYSMGTVFELTPPSTGTTWTEAVLHHFAGNDGASPQAGLVFSSTGILFGTTAKGGLSNSGTVFQLTPSTYPGAWNETVLHNFSGADGANPEASLVLDTSGLLYGTTVHGGTSSHGTIFRSSQ